MGNTQKKQNKKLKKTYSSLSLYIPNRSVIKHKHIEKTSDKTVVVKNSLQ